MISKVFLFLFFIFSNSCLTASDEPLQDPNMVGREEPYFTPANYFGESTVRSIDGNTYEFAFSATVESQAVKDIEILSLPDRRLIAKIDRKSLEEDWTLQALKGDDPWLAGKDTLPFLSLAELLSLPKSAVDDQWNTFMNIQGKRLEVHLKDAGQHIDVQIVQADFLMSTILKKDEGFF